MPPVYDGWLFTLIKISVEHENNIKRRKKNFIKLINVIAPLKVLICYYDNTKENADKIFTHYQKLYQSILPKTDNEFLIIMGKIDLEESKGYLLKVF